MGDYVLNLFDLELPPNDEKQIVDMVKNIETETQEEVAEKTSKKFSMARVPDEEYSNPPNIKIPTVNELVRLLDKSTFTVGRHEFLSDLFECGAIAISNQFDLRNADKREQTYLQIVNKYDKRTQQLIVEMFGKIYLLLTNQIHFGFNDYLGELYMRSETSSKKSGQFFTPYHVSKLCAEMSINQHEINDLIEQDKIITLHEPTCGAGGMIIAAVDVLYNKYHLNYSRNLLVECGDVDRRCVHMTYLQLSLAGVPAVVFHRDALSFETWDRWETPAYIMQWGRFKNVFKGTPSDKHP